ncbi:thiopeptide-type bacteriocin biosynthesis protein [Streptococcus dentapri]|uniref:Thiopeptide-type bacteriocin biosynthesis protein n=1 Tax=Streptococcus dentapri TaxID=573564 RepID=A0ABV8D387_9STRE
MNTNWKSYHMFLWDYSVFDSVIMYMYSLLNDEEKEKLFFIRYWEGGPHLRVRVQESASQRIEVILNMAIQHTIKQYPYIRNIELNKEKYYLEAFTDGEKIDVKQMPWYANMSIEQIPYNPELDRYGGKYLIEYSEKLFCISSKLTNKLLNLKLSSLKKIIIFYYCITEITKSNLPSEEFIGKFYSLGEQFWRNLGVKQSLDEREMFKIHTLASKLHLQPLLEEFIEKLGDLYIVIFNSNHDYADSVLFSHLHMFANRLGINISTELACYSFLEGKVNYDFE